MNAEEIAETVEALRRSLPLVQTGQMSAADGCRIEGALAALRSVGGDPTSHHTRSHVADSIRRLTDRRDAEPIAEEAAGMTATTAHRIDGALIALESLTRSPTYLLAQLAPASRERLDAAPTPDESPWIVTYAGQPQTVQIQL